MIVFCAICSVSSNIFCLDYVLGKIVWANRWSLSSLFSIDSPDYYLLLSDYLSISLDSTLSEKLF